MRAVMGHAARAGAVQEMLLWGRIWRRPPGARAGKTSRCKGRSSSSGTSYLWGKNSSKSVYFQHIPSAFLKSVEGRTCSHDDMRVGDSQAPALPTTSLRLRSATELMLASVQRNTEQGGKRAKTKCSGLRPTGATPETPARRCRPRRMALRNSAISSGDGASSPAPPLRDGASGPVQKLPACCVWLTVSHLAFYKLHQSAECNSSNFLHSSRAV